MSNLEVIALGALASLLAGLGTGVGSLGVFFLRRLSPRLEDGMLSAAAGIMLAASFFSLLLPASNTANVTFDGRSRSAGGDQRPADRCDRAGTDQSPRSPRTFHCWPRRPRGRCDEPHLAVHHRHHAAQLSRGHGRRRRFRRAATSKTASRWPRASGCRTFPKAWRSRSLLTVGYSRSGPSLSER